MFTNEDFADYVVCVSLMYQSNLVRISKTQLTDCINYYYLKYCKARRLKPQPLVPIRSVEKMFLPYGDFFDTYEDKYDVLNQYKEN